MFKEAVSWNYNRTNTRHITQLPEKVNSNSLFDTASAVIDEVRGRLYGKTLYLYHHIPSDGKNMFAAIHSRISRLFSRNWFS